MPDRHLGARLQELYDAISLLQYSHLQPGLATPSPCRRSAWRQQSLLQFG